MEDIVQANSLNSLTNLFANPPQYPRNPTHPKHEPLILYIVRVPGSSDLFLTPLKPVKASISLEAVQHCLYYLHLETTQDEDIKQSISEERLSVDQENIPPQVTRKPLPPTPFANYPQQQRPPIPPKSYPNYQPPLAESTEGSQLDRFQARGSNIRFSTVSERNGASPRKPAGPRPLRSNSLEDRYDIARKPIGQTSTEGRSSLDAASLPRKPVAWSRSISPVKDSQFSRGCIAHERTPTQLSTNSSNCSALGDFKTRSKHATVNVTLIRRDPVSGSQWNVGKMSFPRSFSDNSAATGAQIQLTTPGYQRFRHDFDPEQARTQLAELKRLSQYESFLPDDGDDSQPLFDHNETFERVVEFKPMVETLPAKGHQRSQSFDTRISGDRGSRHVYSFLSPWHGTCLFNTGVDGRSLRCKHMLPAAVGSEGYSSATVAELRLNLPWLVLGNKDPNRQNSFPETERLPIKHLIQPRGKAAIKQKMREIKHKSLNKLSGHHSDELDHMPWSQHERSNQEDLSEDEDSGERISLKLGREKAGGGFSGNSAKLGKLILEDEGLKMADLVVAACMSVFWQQYTRELSE